MCCEEAATELIISHRSWLLRDDFTSQLILQPGRQHHRGDRLGEALTAFRVDKLPWLERRSRHRPPRR
jgi:hypothetical protein